MTAFSAVDSYPYSLSAPDDQGLFQRIALNILNRGAFSGSLAGKAIFCPTRPPLYPLILALTWKITGSTSLLPIRLIQAVCYLFTLYFISRIATMVADGNRRYGLFSALFASLIPFAAAATHVILTESLTLFFLTVTVFFAVSFRTKSGLPSLFALGASLGLLILLRPTFMLIPALFLGYVLLSPKIKKKDVVPVVLAVVLPLAALVVPWTMYVKSETGTCTLVRTGVGLNLMTGILQNNPPLLEDVRKNIVHFQKNAHAGNDLDLIKERESLVRSGRDTLILGGQFPKHVLKLASFCAYKYISIWTSQPFTSSEIVECDQFLKKTALAWAEYHPFGYLQTVAANAATLMFGKFQPLVYHEIGPHLYLFTAAVRWAFLFFFIGGSVLLLKRRKFHVAFFPLALVFYIIIVHSPMHTEPRYFIYAYSFMGMVLPAFLPGGISNDPGRGEPGNRG
ncbi:MAG: glycosyltransferase family 39 protein [Candidatus Sulfobium sp.]